MENIKKRGGGYSLSSNKKPGVLTTEQLADIEKIGVCIIVTCNSKGKPHAVIVEPSKYSQNEIVIPIIQMVTSIKNIEENDNIFIHITREDKKCYENSTQYKIDAVAKIEKSGKLFDEVKHFEETERLPEGLKVNGIVRAKLKKCVQVDG